MGKCVVTGADQIAGINECLEIISICASEPPADFLKIFPPVQFLNYSCPEFIFHRAGQEIFCACLNVFCVIVINPDRYSVPGRRIFDIHCHIINEPVRDQLPHPGRIAAVGIQLDGIPQRFDAVKKFFKLRIKKRLPAGNADAVQNTEQAILSG